jgi:hypothetical protein
MKTVALLALTALLACSTTTLSSDAASVRSAIVTCSDATCGGANASPACAALAQDLLACLVGAAAKNPAACLALAPSVASVGYADIVCVLTDLATGSLPAAAATPASVQPAAAKMLAAQRVLVKKGASP